MSFTALPARTPLPGLLLLGALALPACGGGGGGAQQQDDPPQVTIEGPADGTVLNSSVDITFRATDDLGLATARLDGLGPSPLLPPGPGSLVFTVTDTGGQSATASLDIIIPDTAPEIMLLQAPRDGDVINAAITVGLLVQDGGGIADVTARIDAVAVDIGFTPGTEFTGEVEIDPAQLAPGAHQLSIVATDTAGLINSAAVQFSTPL